MTMDTPWMEEELLAHAAWVRELARGLVRDASDADDLAQDTFVAALRGTPRERGAMRAWLAGIARRLAWKRQRDHRRESDLDDGALEHAGSNPESIERLELHELLAKELRALREPLRATLIERYVHGRSAAQIAERSDVPLATVRSRLKLGLDELRARLDRRFDRETWMSALALAAGSKGAKVAGGSALAGGMLVSTIAKVTAGLVLVVLGVWIAGPRLESERAPALETALAEPASSSRGLEGDEPHDLANSTVADLAQRESMSSAAEAPSSEVPVDAGATRAVARGRCVDLLHEPIEGVEVALLGIGSFDPTWSDPSWQSLVPVQSSFSAKDGRFEALLRVESAAVQGHAGVRVEFRRNGYATESLVIYLTSEPEPAVRDVVLHRPVRVSGSVRDADGNPCVQAAVFAVPRETGQRRLFRDDRKDRPRAVTRVDGSFEMPEAPEGPVWIVARADDGREGDALALILSAGQPKEELELLVPGRADGGWIRGVVLDPSGAPSPRARLKVVHSRAKDSATAVGALGGSANERADEQGRFAFRAERGQRYTLRAASARSQDFGAHASDLEAGANEILLRLEPPRTLRVRALDARSAPLAAFRVTLSSVAATDRWDTSVELGRATSGALAGGELELPMPVEPFTLTAESPSWSPVVLGPLDPARLADALEVRFEQGPNVSGIVLADGQPVAGARLSVFRERDGSEVPSLDGFRARYWAVKLPEPVLSDRSGRFTLLAPRQNGIHIRAELPGRAPARLGPFALASTDAAVDIRLELGNPGAIEGRVLDADGKPVASAFIGVSAGEGAPRGAQSNELGVFRIDDLAAGRYRVRKLEHDIRGGASSLCICGGDEDVRRIDQWDCEVVQGRTTAFDLRLSAPGSVDLRLALDLEPSTSWSVGASTDTDPESLTGGSVHPKPVSEPGTFRLELPRNVLSDVWARASLAGWEIELEHKRIQPLEVPIEITFDERGGSVEGVLSEPHAAGEGITLTWLGAPQRRIRCTTYADERGRFRFPFAPAGECALRRSADKGAGRTVNVKAGETTHLDGL